MKKSLIGLAATFTLLGFSANTQANNDKAALSDDQIAKVVVTASSTEIDASNIAVSKARNQRTKDYAKKMVAEYSDSKSRIETLSKDENFSYADSKLVTKVQKDSDKATQRLEHATAGHEFDRAYLDTQISAHETLVRNINRELLPSATSESLKTHLTTVKDKAQAHLSEARQIRSTL